MIERTFPIDNATIEVSFQWDSGGPGISSGWDGEETGALIKAGMIWTFIAFEVEELTVPEMWRIREVQVNEAEIGEDGKTKHLHGLSLVEYQGDERRRLGDFPTVCAAVSETWAQVQATEALQVALEEVWGHQQLVDELENEVEETGDGHHRLAAARAQLGSAMMERDTLRVLYEERYEHLPQYIPADQLHIDPGYHRGGPVEKRGEIRPLVVNQRADGRYFILDGLARLNAALRMGHPLSVPCEVRHMAEIDEAAEFVALNTSSSAIFWSRGGG